MSSEPIPSVNLAQILTPESMKTVLMYTPLMTAVLRENIEAIQHLLNSDGHASVTMTDPNGNTALMLAVMTRNAHVIGAMCSSSTMKPALDMRNAKQHGITALMIACDYDDGTIAGHLLKAGASLAILDYHGHTAMIRATTLDHVHAFHSLVAHGGDLNDYYTDPTAERRLSIPLLAATLGRLKILQYLHTHVRLPLHVWNQQTSLRENALILAIKCKRNSDIKHTIRVLLRAGVDVNAVDVKGRNAFAWAVCKRIDTDVIQDLIWAGANVFTRNEAGTPILNLATLNITTRVAIEMMLCVCDAAETCSAYLGYCENYRNCAYCSHVIETVLSAD